MHRAPQDPKPSDTKVLNIPKLVQRIILAFFLVGVLTKPGSAQQFLLALCQDGMLGMKPGSAACKVNILPARTILIFLDNLL